LVHQYWWQINLPVAHQHTHQLNLCRTNVFYMGALGNRQS